MPKVIEIRRAMVPEETFLVDYIDDDGLNQCAKFDHDPTQAETAALFPRHFEARRRFRSALTVEDRVKAIAYKLGLED